MHIPVNHTKSKCEQLTECSGVVRSSTTAGISSTTTNETQANPTPTGDFSAVNRVLSEHSARERRPPRPPLTDSFVPLPSRARSAAPVTLGTLNMTGHQGWEDVFVPEKLAEVCCCDDDPLQHRLLVSFLILKVSRMRANMDIAVGHYQFEPEFDTRIR